MPTQSNRGPDLGFPLIKRNTHLHTHVSRHRRGLRHLQEHGPRRQAPGRGRLRRGREEGPGGHHQRLRRLVSACVRACVCVCVFGCLDVCFWEGWCMCLWMIACIYMRETQPTHQPKTQQPTNRITHPTHPPTQPEHGSDASLRYHGERADFSVHNSSRAKFTVEVRFYMCFVWCRSARLWLWLWLCRV